MIDYLNPDYLAVYVERAERILALRKDPALLAATKAHYASAPWDFIRDWGQTFDPRALARGQLAHVPFLPWPKQVEYMEWLYRMWRGGERGLVEKSRDCGVTWLSVGFAVCMWCFRPGFIAGFGSRKQELVDQRGDDKSIFEKARYLIANLPAELLPEGFDEKAHSNHMRIAAPVSGSALIGEAGDNIGRGGRTAIYFVDESAFVEHQDLVDSALSANTECQIDVSTVNGTGNAFYRKRQRAGGTGRLFVFDWRDDPRKTREWYDKLFETFDPVIIAQEYDRDYNASVEDSFIPAEWVAAALDAHITLGFEASGIRAAGFDPADVGDAKAYVQRHGSVVLVAEQKKDGDITHAIPWAFELADTHRADVIGYDADGLGAPSMRLALEVRVADRSRVEPYYGSGAVQDPSAIYVQTEHSTITNERAFLNYRAQKWTLARDRFRATYEAVERSRKGLLVNADPETLISISREHCKEWADLQSELSRPKRIFTPNGKIKVEGKDKMRARGVDSPNLADAFVIALSMQRAAVMERSGARRPARDWRA